ncbi:MAG: helix-turn-helix domain-containing protein [Nitrospinae bacterium]|nr:helix-turn-helix domain-containing protein [Nitrospinota bacterium]
MPQKKRVKLILKQEDIKYLKELERNRTEPYMKIKRAKIILVYAGGMRISDIMKHENIDRPVVERCIDKALSGGIETALKDLPRSGRPPIITANDDNSLNNWTGGVAQLVRAEVS